MKTELKRSYDFDEIIERRHTNALNTDGFRSYIFHAGPEKNSPIKTKNLSVCGSLIWNLQHHRKSVKR